MKNSPEKVPGICSCFANISFLLTDRECFGSRPPGWPSQEILFLWYEVSFFATIDESCWLKELKRFFNSQFVSRPLTTNNYSYCTKTLVQMFSSHCLRLQQFLWRYHCGPYNPFQANFPFLYPFSGGIEMEHWLEMGLHVEVTKITSVKS